MALGAACSGPANSSALGSFLMVIALTPFHVLLVFGEDMVNDLPGVHQVACPAGKNLVAQFCKVVDASRRALCSFCLPG